MSDLKLLQYAYYGALKNWRRCKERLEEYPNNLMLKRTERRAWQDFQFIEAKLKQAERENK